MDRKYIENEHVVERYLSGDLTVREAREFEQYCLEHPEALRAMPIPVRLKARLGRRPADDTETGVFQTIPSSAARAALRETEEGFDPEEAREEMARAQGGVNRNVAIALGVALIAALAGTVMYAMRAGGLEAQIRQMQRAERTTTMQAYSSQQVIRVQPVRGKPSQPTLAIGRPTPPVLLDLRIDVSETKYQSFLVTIDKVDGGRAMQLRRVGRDSNNEVRIGLNSSAFSPGSYLFTIEGYTWKGQPERYGWLLLDLE